MANKNIYGRYDGNNKVVPGSFILRDNKPTEGKWGKFIDESKCQVTPQPAATNFEITQTSSASPSFSEMVEIANLNYFPVTEFLASSLTYSIGSFDTPTYLLDGWTISADGRTLSGNLILEPNRNGVYTNNLYMNLGSFGIQSFTKFGQFSPTLLDAGQGNLYHIGFGFDEGFDGYWVNDFMEDFMNSCMWKWGAFTFDFFSFRAKDIIIPLAYSGVQYNVFIYPTCDTITFKWSSKIGTEGTNLENRSLSGGMIIFLTGGENSYSGIECKTLTIEKLIHDAANAPSPSSFIEILSVAGLTNFVLTDPNILVYNSGGIDDGGLSIVFGGRVNGYQLVDSDFEGVLEAWSNWTFNQNVPEGALPRPFDIGFTLDGAPGPLATGVIQFLESIGIAVYAMS